MILLVGVAVAGAVGAPTRYAIDVLVQQRARGVFPWGTFLVNSTGSFLLGLVTGLGLHHGLGPVPKTLLGTGFCGAYTTFSTFSYETLRLVEDGTIIDAVLNVLASLAVGLLAAAAGLGIAAIG
ncbi:MAG: fluoride efflux transporter CrcB [Actinobacteria bacterium]|nr:fluoride efflux transporter CrcB [Actinomycetota bacterium]